MKKNVLLLIIVTLSFQVDSLIAQKKVIETTIEVEGVCDNCKHRIENAAYVKGVKFAQWDKHTKKLKIAYKSDKITLEEIQKSIANAGHDSGEIKADSTSYAKLPACCAYRNKDIKTH